MIAGIVKGPSFTGLIRYVFLGRGPNPEPRGHLLGGTLVAGDVDDAIEFFEALRRLRPDHGNPARHVWISLPPGETLTPLQWLEVAELLAERLGLAMWILVGHDSRCQHVHLVGSMIGPDGTIGNATVRREPLRDYRIIEKACRTMEVRFGLQRMQGPTRPRTKHGRVAQDRRVTVGEQKMTRDGRQSAKQRLCDTIDAVLAAGYQMGGVLLEMMRRGYVPYTTWRDGRPVGITWEEVATGQRFRGARLGAAYGGRRWWDRIGGLGNGTGCTIDLDAIPAYDSAAAWARIVRGLSAPDAAGMASGAGAPRLRTRRPSAARSRHDDGRRVGAQSPSLDRGLGVVAGPGLDTPPTNRSDADNRPGLRRIRPTSSRR